MTNPQLNFLLEKIPTLSSREEIFDLTCRISAATQDLTSADLASISSINNFHIKAIFEVFNHKLFITNLETLLRLTYEERMSAPEERYICEKQTIQLFLRLSFFLVAVLLPVLDKQDIVFLRRHLGSSISKTQQHLIEKGLIFTKANLLFLLEQINFDVTYRFQKRTPGDLTLNTDFLNMGQISSRIIVGSLLLYRIGYWVLPELITEVTKDNKNPAKLFSINYRAQKLIGAYTNYNRLLGDRYFSQERRDSLKESISLFRDNNIEDLMFLIDQMSLDFKTKESHYFSIEAKMKCISLIKMKIQKRFEQLSVFSGEQFASNWSNKAFLRTMQFLSILESVSTAKDTEWKIHTVDHFFNEWMNRIYELVNFYRLDDVGAIAVYVEGESDRIILENAYDKLFPGQDKYIFYEVGGSHELFKKINAPQINDLGGLSFGIFDFDSAYNDFNGLRLISKGVNGFSPAEGVEEKCLFRVREEGFNKIFAILLPVPPSRKDLASAVFKEKSMLSVELLFEDTLLQKLGNFSTQKIPGGTVPIFVGDKIEFAKKTASLQKDDFHNFVPLFNLLNEVRAITFEIA